MGTSLFWFIRQRVVIISYWRFGTTYRSHLQGSGIQKEIILDSLTPKMGPIGCPETSVINYHYSLRNNPEERSSQCPVFQKPKVHHHIYNILLLEHIVSASSVQFTFSEQFICIPFRCYVVRWSTPQSTMWSFLLNFVNENDLPISCSLCMLHDTLIVSSLIESL